MDAWEKICRSFATAAVEMLEGFGRAFTAFPDLDLAGGGIANAYSISLGLGILVAVILLLIQTGATALTASGKPLAHGLVGLGKAVMAFVLTLTVAGTALAVSDQIADWIIDETFSTDSASGGEVLQDKFAALFSANAAVSVSLLLLLAIAGIVLTLVLWFELLLRNAAIAVLIAASPIAASGQIGSATKDWWPKLVSATIQLIMLKPVIALIFAIGFSLLGQSDSDDLAGLLSGMLVLMLAALAWPAIARFFTFTSTTVGGGAGLAAVAGAGAGMAGSSAMGGTAGVSPTQFAQSSTARSEGTVARAQHAASTGGAGAAGATGAVGKAAGAAKFANPWVAAAATGLRAVQKGANTMVQRTEQMGGHAGIQGSNPYALPAGQPMYNTAAIQAAQRGRGDTNGDQRPGPGAPRAPEPPPEPAPAPPDTKLPGNEPKDGGPS
ncbi:hypothetical protein [Glycomyces salinus]|uniref:hypothetical protein n=1 Tax=Glycomyces salinus TaxID=980294 RepID=UPI0018EB8146|nr:hypothetical protein [Glycomyces salinus]